MKTLDGCYDDDDSIYKCHLLVFFQQPLCDRSYYITLQKRRLTQRLEWFSQAHTSSEEQNQDVNPGLKSFPGSPIA